jgi:hypothetical protein
MATSKMSEDNHPNYKDIHKTGFQGHLSKISNFKKKQSSQSSKLAQGPSGGGGGD